MTKPQSRDSKRYYIHRMIKKYGGCVKSYSRTIELIDDLFQETPEKLKKYIKILLFNYKYQINSVITYEERRKKHSTGTSHKS